MTLIVSFDHHDKFINFSFNQFKKDTQFINDDVIGLMMIDMKT